MAMSRSVVHLFAAGGAGKTERSHDGRAQRCYVDHSSVRFSLIPEREQDVQLNNFLQEAAVRGEFVPGEIPGILADTPVVLAVPTQIHALFRSQSSSQLATCMLEILSLIAEDEDGMESLGSELEPNTMASLSEYFRTRRGPIHEGNKLDEGYLPPRELTNAVETLLCYGGNATNWKISIPCLFLTTMDRPRSDGSRSDTVEHRVPQPPLTRSERHAIAERETMLRLHVSWKSLRRAVQYTNVDNSWLSVKLRDSLARNHDAMQDIWQVAMEFSGAARRSGINCDGSVLPQDVVDMKLVPLILIALLEEAASRLYC